MKKPFLAESQESEYNPWNWDIDYDVPSKSHKTSFKKIRSARIDLHVVETNKLLIRLDKLLTEIPSDPGKRKVHEKEIVPWVNDKDVPLCPFCARSFNLPRRRHHCRLCGGIMCADCSKLLSFSAAERLVYPVHQGSSDNVGGEIVTSREESSSTSGKILGSFLGTLKRTGSHGSLHSLMAMIDAMGNDAHFRICSHCLRRLNTRKRQVDRRRSKILLSIYYDKLMDARSEVAKYIPQFEKMAESITMGEVTYSIRDAEEFRMKILRVSDTVGMLAAKIKNLGASGVAYEGSEVVSSPDGEKMPPGPRQELLQKRIHSASATFLKTSVLSLPKIPTAKQVIALRSQRRLDIDAKLEAEREDARQAEERVSNIPQKSKKSNNGSYYNSTHSRVFSTPERKRNEEVVNIDTGWGLDADSRDVIETDDPLIQQMNIIRNFIKQARDACKYDEVSLLERNLKELQLEFKKHQQLLES